MHISRSLSIELPPALQPPRHGFRVPGGSGEGASEHPGTLQVLLESSWAVLGGFISFSQWPSRQDHIGSILGHNGLLEGAAGPSLFFSRGVVASGSQTTHCLFTKDGACGKGV